MKALEALFRLIQGVALILWLALWPLPAALAQDAPVMRTVQVSPSAWYVEGLSALGSTANQNFVSNAAFVVTPAGVVSSMCWARRRWRSAFCRRSAS